MAHGDHVGFHGVAVDGDAEGRADFVLAAVATADGGLFIVEGGEAGLAQHGGDGLGLFGHAVLFDQREDRRGDGRDLGVEVQHHAGVLLELLFLVGVDHEGQRHAVDAAGGLDHVGGVLFLRLRIEVEQVRARSLAVAGQVEIGAVGDAFEFAPAEGVLVFDVGGGLGVVGQLFGIVHAQAQFVRIHAEVDVPLVARLDPVIEPLLVFGGRHEVLHLGLLEFARAEHKVAGGDLVAEGLADLGNSKRGLDARRVEHVLEVQEDALGRLGAQVGHRARVLHRAHVGLEHHVELAGLGQFTVALAGHLAGLFQAARVLELVRAEAALALLAVHHGVTESPHVPRGLPGLGVLDDGRVQADHIGSLGDHGPPPSVLDPAQELDPQGAVVVGVAHAPVDLRGLVDEPPALAEGDDLVHQGGRLLGHGWGRLWVERRLQPGGVDLSGWKDRCHAPEAGGTGIRRAGRYGLGCAWSVG